MLYIDSDDMNFEAFQIRYFDEMISHFKALGFAIRRRGEGTLEVIDEDINGNKQFVSIGADENRSGGINTAITGYLYFHSVDKYFVKHQDRIPNLVGWFTIGVEPKNLDENFVIESKNIDGLPNTIEKIKRQYQAVILPRLKLFSNVLELDKYANTPLEKFHQEPPLFDNNGHWYRKMILAKLAGNADYEMICKYVFDLYRKGIEKYPNKKNYHDELWVAEQIYNELKYQEPLLNPQLMEFSEN